MGRTRQDCGVACARQRCSSGDRRRRIELVKGRTAYVGADLRPLETETIALDLDDDPLPDKHFDYAVLLGVFGYLHQPEAAAKKLCGAADRIIVSYCCRRTELEPQAVFESRRRRGWINSFDQTEFIKMFSRHGHELTSSVLFSTTDEFEQFVMEFRRSDLGRARRRRRDVVDNRKHSLRHDGAIGLA